MAIKTNLFKVLAGSLILFGGSGAASAQTFNELTAAEAEEECNKSVVSAQQCQKLQNYARLMGFKDLLQYLHFVEVVERAEATGRSIVDKKPIYETEAYIQAVKYVESGKNIPSELEAEVELLIKDRQELIASTLGLSASEVDNRLDSYRRYHEFTENQSQLENTQFVTLSSDNDGKYYERIETTARKVDSWGNSSLSVKLGATQLIIDSGIEQVGIFPVTVVIVVTDTLKPQQRTFKFKESTGAIPLENTWQPCPDCPVGIQPH